ncbi:hypothetical protein CKO25_11680 [Thiocapsa imhoffii]|uniref:histidine kinase n=1 Tax=Thiocapsa imhoffii TaxID=382777 RepID=A0A9X1B8Y6_9GAMM|nr:XrtA/PEP-CTERM system histidine kinase PrsK [Thiocapsa imhoffii]MBK1645287.1 hypothetical protein [Thiocapsa imhoffii]
MLTFPEMGAIGYGLVALLSTLLAALLVLNWRGRMQGTVLLIAAGLNALWAAACAIQALWKTLPVEAIWVLESLRALAWILFLARLLALQLQGRTQALRHLRAALWTSAAIVLLLLVPFESLVAQVVPSAYAVSLQARLLAHVLLAVVGLVLVEQIYRNTLWQYRQDIRFLCFGLGLLFGIDFFVYAEAMLTMRIDANLWLARGPLNLFVIPLIAISAGRNPQWSTGLFISRTIVFNTTVLMTAGVYLILMSLAGYWLNAHKEQWGGPLQLVLFAGSSTLLIFLFLSGTIRARLKVFIAKHFYRSRYEYREEWIRVTRRLSGEDLHATLPARILLTMSELVDRPGGAIWTRDAQDGFLLAFSDQIEGHLLNRSWDAQDFARGLERINWILDLSEYERNPSRYPGLDVPPWMRDLKHFSLVVPILHERRILAFVLLVRPSVPHPLNWETIDLLKTAAQQAASYLALENTLSALAEVRQFEGFNRVSAFVVHDLKNLVAQLSLVVRNAERHKDNPAFVDDAFATVASAVAKMSRLLLQLRGVTPAATLEKVALTPMLEALVSESGQRLPQPVLEVATGLELIVEANADRLKSVIDNLIRNAQEATDRTGAIRVRLEEQNGQAILEVEDTGIGMSAEFIEQRLFRPFDSTKGLAGMGIGAYECREFILALGGQVKVMSTPGVGTCFRIAIPLAQAPVASLSQVPDPIS